MLLTAGAAGMYCGSCMHDNALARAMRELGDDVLLQPIYTPIRTDETDIAEDRVFFGGIHVFAMQKMPWLSKLPQSLRSWMDWPRLIRFVTRRAGSTDPASLGELTLSMLRGHEGRQSDEVHRFVDWLCNEIQPDAVIFSNLLIGGSIPEIRRRCPNCRVVVLLQGDDIFLDHLQPHHRSSAIELMQNLSAQVHQFVSHSHFYRQKMSDLLSLPDGKVAVHPLSISLPPASGCDPEEAKSSDGVSPFRIGYLARIAPEKGLDRLADAFIRIANQTGFEHVELHAAGWLGNHHKAYLAGIKSKIDSAGFADRFTYHGSPERDEKFKLLRSFDVLSVPAPYEDPKGLFILESLAVGTPVIQPDHGAFGELLRDLGGGELVNPDEIDALAEALQRSVMQPDRKNELLVGVAERLQERHSIDAAAKRMREACQSPTG
ncbi:MAG: glycosyltransferase family 4 protein [Planctomycetota bacterium]